MHQVKGAVQTAEAALGVDPAWVKEHAGTIDHFFHLAAIYDMTASEEQNETLNVGGTRNALELAADLDAVTRRIIETVAGCTDEQWRRATAAEG